MKIALISHEGGGISSVTSGLARGLYRRGIDVTVFTGLTKAAMAKKKNDEDYKFVYLPIPDLFPRNMWFQILNHNKLINYLQEFDVVHGVSPYASLGQTFFKGKTGKPFVSTLHDSHRYSRQAFLNQPSSSWTLSEIAYNFGAFPLYDYTLNRVIDHSDKVVMCSYSLLAKFAAYRKIDYGKVSVIQNGVDFEQIDSLSEQLAQMNKDVSILFAGRLFWTKGSLMLLNAFEKLCKNHDNVHLTIYGKGPLKSVLEKYVECSNLKSKVSLPGFIPHKKMLSEIKKCDIVAFPSIAEAQPMFILESMACKKPVVAFDLPFAREVIDDMNTGVLAKPQDLDDLAKKLGLLVADVGLRKKIGQSAYDYVKRLHNWDIQIEKYLKVYQAAMKR